MIQIELDNSRRIIFGKKWRKIGILQSCEFEDENYRLNIAKIFKLIVDTEKFEEEKKTSRSQEAAEKVVLVFFIQ